MLNISPPRIVLNGSDMVGAPGRRIMSSLSHSGQCGIIRVEVGLLRSQQSNQEENSGGCYQHPLLYHLIPIKGGKDRERRNRQQVNTRRTSPRDRG